ncbi:hypothetical protein C0995_013484 [Termitomyces sp. Mi166|nr:hypothetical protein C0995_013484 [Termitomyces sp. Mi166\
MILQKTHPEVLFQGLILMDPGILPPGRPSSIKLAGLFNKMALLKRDTWASVEEARQDLSRKGGAYRGFVPATLESFLVRHCLPHFDAVTLTCSKAQEGAYYAANDMILPPAEALIKLSKEDRLPIHLIVCLKDEYRGMSDDMKAFQVETVGKMSCGSVQFIEKGGHMVSMRLRCQLLFSYWYQFPQVEPALTATYLRKALIRIWNLGVRL